MEVVPVRFLQTGQCSHSDWILKVSFASLASRKHDNGVVDE